jgi:parvulin-like peptidyl-prolyl isomerase
MSRRSIKGPAVVRWSWRKIALASACLAGLLGAGYGVRLALLPRATAQADQPAAAAPVTQPAEVATPGSDYSRRVVAYLNDTEPVTREELGEYLIARHGPEKLGTLVNKGIIEQACRKSGIEVTAAEVESALAEELRTLNMDVATFTKSFLTRYKQNLYEWKEDVVRPRLLLTKLCRDRVRVTDEDLQKAFEARYGEKIECRIILYGNGEEARKKAVAEYPKVRDSEEAFDHAARHQEVAEYAAAGGKIKPFGRFEMGDPQLDQLAFRLQPGEVSEVMQTRQGWAILKCLRHIPADTSRSLDAVRDALAKEVNDNKVAQEMQTLVPELRKRARPRLLLTRPSSGSLPTMPEDAGPPRPNQVVAWYNGDVAVTRENLGEYLIACFGAERLEYMINERIISKECAARGVAVSTEEVNAALKSDLDKLKVDEKTFVGQFLSNFRTNLYTYCEDVVRQRLLMTKLSQDRVRVTDEDLHKAFDAYYGERLKCRIILWPPDQTKFALAEYPRIRDSEAAFAEKAKQQASAALAAHGGEIDEFGRHTLGDEALEEAAFKLQPGEISTLIGTPQGNVVIKCDKRIPPSSSVNLEAKRAELEKEVRERKVQLEMQMVFRELKEKAHPNLLLKDASRPTDIAAETTKALEEVKDLIRRPGGPATPQAKP